MDSNCINAAGKNNALNRPCLLDKKAKPEPNAPKFLQMLNEATAKNVGGSAQAAPATLSRLQPPRSPQVLTSLNPVQTSYVPQAAALESVGQSRIVPFVVNP